MAQQQINVNIASVGFNGLNTEDSPITQDSSFADVADNAVIDKFGRIGARKAFSSDTATFPTLPAIPTAVSEEIIIDIIEGGTIAGVANVIMTGRNVGYDIDGNVVGTDYYMFNRNGSSLEEITLPAVNDKSSFQYAEIIPTDDRFYVCSEGNEVMIWNGTNLSLISSQVGYQGIQNIPAGAQVAPTFTGALAAFGRIWGYGHEGDANTIYYSDLLIGASNYTVDGIDPLSTAGKLNVLENWPNGRDSIVGLAAHNNRLIVFGIENMLIYDAGYGDPADPASGFTLEDTISNVGLVSRDAVVNIGSDVLFADHDGVRSVGRTIQERSSPMGNLTVKVRQDVGGVISDTIDKRSIKMAYDHANNFAVLLLSEQSLAYCLDLKSYLSTGLAKITRWTDCYFNDIEFIEEEGLPKLYLGCRDGIGVGLYDGYVSAQNDYIFKYYSNQLNFGEPAKLKFLKQIDYTIISGLAPTTGFAKWGYDTLSTYKSKSLAFDAQPSSLYGVAEFGIAKYGDSDSVYKRYKVNTSGNGESVKVGLEATINGNSLSLQEINIQTLIGRTN